MQIPVQGPLYTKLYTICLLCNDGVLEIRSDTTQINRKLRRLHSGNSFSTGAGSHVRVEKKQTITGEVKNE